MSNARLKLAKSPAEAKQRPEAELLNFIHPHYHPKLVRRYSKKCEKQVCLF